MVTCSSPAWVKWRSGFSYDHWLQCFQKRGIDWMIRYLHMVKQPNPCL